MIVPISTQSNVTISSDHVIIAGTSTNTLSLYDLSRIEGTPITVTTTGSTSTSWVTGGAISFLDDGTTTLALTASPSFVTLADGLTSWVGVVRTVAPSPRPTRRPVRLPSSAAEVRARNSLRDCLSEREYKRFLVNGFLLVRGASGLVYQAFLDQRRTAVWRSGKMIAELCIHTLDCPPSDHLLNVKILAEMDEQSLWRESRVTRLSDDLPFAA